MDSPLTTAELSRLRKAIHQRERFLSQGLSTATAELNISRALSNLKLYLSQSQPQLAAVLKDWDGADRAKKDQIVAWLRQNVLNEQIPQATPPISALVRRSLAGYNQLIGHHVANARINTSVKVCCTAASTTLACPDELIPFPITTGTISTCIPHCLSSRNIHR
jgi:hypothetical protein